jgi:hypothetical protein
MPQRKIRSNSGNPITTPIPTPNQANPTNATSDTNSLIQNLSNTSPVNNLFEDGTSIDNYASVNSSELERRIDDKDDKDSEVSSIGKKSETEIKSDIKLAKTKKFRKIDADKKLHSNIETIIFEESEEENDEKDNLNSEKLKLGKSHSVANMSKLFLFNYY